jgi:hypothetical protein
MKYLFILIVTSVISMLAVSCGTSLSRVVKNPDKVAVNTLCLSPEITDQPYTSLRRDPFHIENLSVEKNYLQVVFSYGGGCGDVNWDVYFNQLIKQSFPPQISFKMTMMDNDPCRAIITDTISVCLDEFESLARAGGVVIRVDPSEMEVMYSLPLN